MYMRLNSTPVIICYHVFILHLQILCGMSTYTPTPTHLFYRDVLGHFKGAVHKGRHAIFGQF